MYSSLPQNGALWHKACEGPDGAPAGVARDSNRDPLRPCVKCPTRKTQTGEFPLDQRVKGARADRKGASRAVSWRLREKPDRHAACTTVLRQDGARGSVSEIAGAPVADRAPRASRWSRSEPARGPSARGRDRAAGRTPRRTGSPQPTRSRARLGPVHKGVWTVPPPFWAVDEVDALEEPRRGHRGTSPQA